jgi:probable F420-dependent oxidoreductase
MTPKGPPGAPHPRRLRFAIEMKGPFEGMSWADSARHVEALGLTTLMVPDHFEDGLGPVAAMATAAAATTTLRVGAMVLDCDLRHPAVLARELASLDVLSGGRLEVGLGAGWSRADYERSGIPMDPPKIRVDRLIEHVTVLRGLFGSEPFDFSGDHYEIRRLTGTPAPLTPGGPPLLIAGGGRRLLRFAARHGDVVGVNRSIRSGVLDAAAARDGLPAAIDEKIAWVREAAGDRWSAIELNSWVSVASVTPRPSWLAARLAAVWQAEPAEILASPFTLVGSEGQVIERLHANRERWGYSYYVLQQDAVGAFAPVVAAATGT